LKLILTEAIFVKKTRCLSLVKVIAALLIYLYLLSIDCNPIRNCLAPSPECLIPRRSFIVEANTFNMRLSWQAEEHLECCHRGHYMDLFSSPSPGCSSSGGQVAWNTWHLPLTCGMSPDMWAALDASFSTWARGPSFCFGFCCRRSSHLKIFPRKMCLALADCLSVVRKILFSLCIRIYIYIYAGSDRMDQGIGENIERPLPLSVSRWWSSPWVKVDVHEKF